MLLYPRYGTIWCMKREREVFRPRAIDRAMFAILATLHVANGLYLVGPWYLDETDTGKAPLIAMFNSMWAVVIYGGLLLFNGLMLFYATAGRSGRRHTFMTELAMLWGFLLRLYALIGVFLVAESWKPPSYLSHVATVAMLGAYWVWVKVNVRPVQ